MAIILSLALRTKRQDGSGVSDARADSPIRARGFRRFDPKFFGRFDPDVRIEDVAGEVKDMIQQCMVNRTQRMQCICLKQNTNVAVMPICN
ncbi:MAG: hypothetical protein KGO48_00115 [Alphaproteobacteria bacterium]|nr:hypothetical protein [Alphaproteobacteria bacterium]